MYFSILNYFKSNPLLIFRLFFLLLSILIIKQVFIGFSIFLTFTILLLPCVLVFFSLGNDEDAIKSSSMLFLILVAIYFFSVLATVAFSLYWTLTFSMFVLQEWVFSEVYSYKNEISFYEDIRKNFTFMKLLSYITIPIVCLYFADKNLDWQNFEQLRTIKLNFFHDLKAQIFNNPDFLGIAQDNFNNGLDQTKAIIKKGIGTLGLIYLIMTLIYSSIPVITDYLDLD